MRFIKFFSLFFISIFIISCLSLNVIGKSNNSISSSDNQVSSDRPIIDEIMKKIFNLGSYTFGFPWHHQEFIPPSFYRVSPPVVDLEYLNETEIVIAEIWPDGEIKEAVFLPEDTIPGQMQRYMFISQDFVFELIQPEDSTTNGLWDAKFEPNVIRMLEDRPEDEDKVPLLKTKLKLKLYLPSDVEYPQEDINLKIKITRLDTSGNLWIPPNFGPYKSPVSKFFWLFGAITTWGKYSGTVEEIISYVNVTVRVSTFHLAEILPPKPIKLSENEIKSIPIKVRNIGTRIDTFNFKVKSNSDELKLSPPPAITLKPGEEETVYLGVATPRWIADQGTVHPVKIEMFSIDQPDKVFSNTVTITTQGVYVSQGGAYYSVPIVILLIFIGIIYFYIQKKNYEKICEKPEKPWNIPEEQKKLEKLKEKNPEKYDKEIKMMKQEYQSALLWYKHFCQAKIKKQKEKQRKKLEEQRIKKRQERIEKQKEEQKQQETQINQQQFIEEKTQTIEHEKPSRQQTIPQPKTYDNKEEIKLRKKQEAIKRIYSQQEKQRKKLSK